MSAPHQPAPNQSTPDRPAPHQPSLSGTTAIVTGASRGFGRATAVALAGRGARVVGVARSTESLSQLGDQLGDRFVAVVADVTDPDLAEQLVREHRPRVLVLNAGAAPPLAPLRDQTWESFSTNWNVDVAHAFAFTRAALTAPLEPGSVVVSMSSGAAVKGSPLSGGYAGAKATVRILSSYAAAESQQAGSGIRFVAVLPALTPATELGRPYAQAYSARAGIDQERFLAGLGGELSTDHAAAAITDLILDDTRTAPAYLITAAGTRPADPDAG